MRILDTAYEPYHVIWWSFIQAIWW